MSNPNIQKNYSNQAIQKRLSGSANNNIKGNNNINKTGSKLQSNVKKEQMELNKISVNNVRNSYRKQNSNNNHLNQVEMKFPNNIKNQINSNNQINQKPTNKKIDMNPKTYQLMFKNPVGKQNQGVKQKNPAVKQNQVGNQNQGGTQNQRGKQNPGVKPVIKKNNESKINGQIFLNKANNNKEINNNMILNLNKNINLNSNNQQKLRGKPPTNQTPNQPKYIKYVKLSREDKTFCINSTLYCLANNEKINKYLFDIYKNEKLENSQRLITFLFWRIIYHLNMKDTDEYSLKNFYQFITSYNLVLKDINSKNLVDFLIFLLEQFHEENKKFRKKNQEIELKEEIYSNIKNS